MDEYSILKKDQIDLIQWLAPQLGISIKKKESVVEKTEEKKEDFYHTISDIVSSQNHEYEEM